MPEGPECTTTACKLNEKLSGHTLLEIKVDPRFSKGVACITINKYLPAKLQVVSCKGKKIFFNFVEAESEFALVSGMGMTGSWLFSQGEHTLVEMIFDEFSIYYNDPRRIGSCLVYLADREEIDNLLATLGHDLLSQAIEYYNEGVDEVDLWLQIVPKSRRSVISNYLLSQDDFSGIGNYLKSDILYLARIDPERKIGSLSEVDLRRLYYSGLYVIYSSYLVGGYSIKNYVHPGAEKGGYQPLVYGRSIDDLGYEVVKLKPRKSSRSTYWVPELQR